MYQLIFLEKYITAASWLSFLSGLLASFFLQAKRWYRPWPAWGCFKSLPDTRLVESPPGEPRPTRSPQLARPTGSPGRQSGGRGRSPNKACIGKRLGRMPTAAAYANVGSVERPPPATAPGPSNAGKIRKRASCAWLRPSAAVAGARSNRPRCRCFACKKANGFPVGSTGN